MARIEASIGKNIHAQTHNRHAIANSSSLSSDKLQTTSAFTGEASVQITHLANWTEIFSALCFFCKMGRSYRENRLSSNFPERKCCQQALA